MSDRENRDNYTSSIVLLALYIAKTNPSLSNGYFALKEYEMFYNLYQDKLHILTSINWDLYHIGKIENPIIRKFKKFVYGVKLSTVKSKMSEIVEKLIELENTKIIKDIIKKYTPSCHKDNLITFEMEAKEDDWSY